ncbi:penicillin-binding transpeptidase domain-containing protein [uncultured Jatrophihabitans sp.]|uniref:penicillin-binding transpeptidase domain-containing protein n=1 Tax=uncultured Jatrophihabitans sp. TaxID=1610747 RepID=UPI0035CB9036
MNRPIRKVSVAVAVLFLALFVNLNVVQVVQGSSYRDNSDNRRVLLNEYSHPRGQIVVDGTAVAQSRATPDESLKYLRTYPQGPIYAPVTGSFSFIYGSSGIEEAENDVLSGDSPTLFTTNLASLLTGRDPRGGSVELTLNKAAQTAAYKAMRLSNGTYRPGAIVALDPSTGAILAAVSTPSYDPTALSSHSSDEISHAASCYNDLPSQNAGESDAKYKARLQAEIVKREPSPTSKGCSDVPDDPTAFLKANPTELGPLNNRAFKITYPPGSIFKVIVAAAALRAGIKPDDQIFAPQYYWPDDAAATQKQTPCAANDTGPCIHNFTLSSGYREQCKNGSRSATLDFALEKSCNTAFAALAVEKLGVAKIAAEAKLFGLDTAPLKIPLTTAGSTIGDVSELGSDPVALAQSAFGQRNVAITPLQAAMISAAVAQNGTLYQPYLVKNTRRPNTSILDTTKPTQLSQVIDPDLDSELVTMMENVVTGKEAGDDATGKAAAITDLPNVVVGGKTGTADHQDANGKALPAHSWFSGFALVKGSAKIAVAVILEDSDATGGEDAAPKARQVMEAYLRDVGTN